MHRITTDPIFRLLLAVLASGSMASGQSPTMTSHPEEMNDWQTAGKAYSAYFGNKTVSDLAEIASSDSIQLALLAKWESLGCGELRTIQAEPARFIGFFEGKTGVVAPLWWRYQMTETACRGLSTSEHRAITDEMLRAGVLSLSGSTKVVKPPSTRKSTLGLFVPEDVELEKRGASIVVLRGKQSATLPAEEFVKERRGRQCNVFIDEQRVVVAFHDDFGETFPMSCYERETGRILWKSTVWGRGHGPPAYSGFWRHDVHFLQRGDLLYIFGTGTFRPYAECIDLRTGKGVFRFSTGLWGVARGEDDEVE